MYKNDLFQNMNMESNVTGNNDFVENNMNIDVNMSNNGPQMMPSSDGVQQRVINRTFIHDVPHTCPIHTRIINHHVYRHTYRPVYTCSEENVCSNIECGSCSQFK